MDIRGVDAANMYVYRNICQSYEGEFSAITGKLPDEHGLFALDTELGGTVHGFLLYEGQAPVGLAALRLDNGYNEVCEFYVLPALRGKGLGRCFAHALWRRFPGQWEVKQLEGALAATSFWLGTIGEFTQKNFTQDIFDDPYWGRVRRQRFVSIPAEHVCACVKV